MATETKIPKKPERPEKQIVEQLAEDVALDGWKVTSYTTKQDVEKEERSLTISMHRSTGDAKQGEMDLAGDKPKGGRRRVHVVPDEGAPE